MSLDVKVKIQLSKPAGSAGTWFPLIVVEDSEATATTYGEYKELADIVTAGYADSTDAYTTANTIFSQNNAPEKVAILKATTITAETIAPYMGKNWRQIVNASPVADGATLAAYVETTDRTLFLNVATVDALKTLYGKVKEYDRTFICYHTDTTLNVAAAVVGATAGYAAGSITYKNIILKGVPALDLSDTEIDEIHANGAITVLEKAGDIVTSEGKVAGGEYMDVIDSQDYVIQSIEYKVQKIFNTNKKVPYTNAGIGMLETAVLGVLVNAYNNGIIAEGDDGKPIYTVDFALRSETTAEDRTARKYPYGKFSFELAGAIHNAEITGEITV
jgi:hypothetical protein